MHRSFTCYKGIEGTGHMLLSMLINTEKIAKHDAVR